MTTKPCQKALFLDRDGIINVDHGYVSKIEDFEFSKGIFEFTKHFQEKGFQLFVVTNQSGIGRGYYREEDFEKVTQWMIEAFKEKDIRIEHVFHCPHTPEANCRCRKPEIGMIEAAVAAYPLDLAHSWMIGDKASDMQLANNAGITHTIFIGEDHPINATLSFPTLEACKSYFQENPGKI